MSGGRFNYDQRRITGIADTIESYLRNDDIEMSKSSRRLLKKIVRHLRVSAIYAQRADWYLSGDDGDESFIRRTKEDLGES